jgi:hypothetical protein
MVTGGSPNGVDYRVRGACLLLANWVSVLMFLHSAPSTTSYCIWDISNNHQRNVEQWAALPNRQIDICTYGSIGLAPSHVNWAIGSDGH